MIQIDDGNGSVNGWPKSSQDINNTIWHSFNQKSQWAHITQPDKCVRQTHTCSETNKQGIWSTGNAFPTAPRALLCVASYEDQRLLCEAACCLLKGTGDGERDWRAPFKIILLLSPFCQLSTSSQRNYFFPYDNIIFPFWIVPFSSSYQRCFSSSLSRAVLRCHFLLNNSPFLSLPVTLQRGFEPVLVFRPSPSFSLSLSLEENHTLISFPCSALDEQSRKENINGLQQPINT